jgi:o-succinylbenzoate synthase
VSDDLRHRRFRLQAVDLRRLGLPLASPLVTGRGTYRQRSLLLLRVCLDVDGRVQWGWGEAAPLPGWNDDDLDELARIARTLSDGAATRTLNGLLREQTAIEARPALRFALECAVLDALARLEGISLSTALARARGVEPAAKVAVQCTLGDCDGPAAIQALASAQKAGFTHAKLKIGARDARVDRERIRSIVDAGLELTLRLDANGALRTSDALRLLDALPPDRVEWVEQPVDDADFDALLERYEGSGPAIAADESCCDPTRVAGLLESGRLGAVVVKPAALGGLDRAEALFDRARDAGAAVMISNLMESAVGRAAVADLAAAWPELEGPHGLATGDWFARDLAPQPDRIEGGRLALHAGPGLGFDPVPD